MLKCICQTLDIERSGKKEEIVERIMNFLKEPKDSGKPLTASAKKRECYATLVFMY